MRKYNLETRKMYYDKHNIKYIEFKNFYMIFNTPKSYFNKIKSYEFLKYLAEFTKSVIMLVVFPLSLITNLFPNVRLKNKEEN